MSRLALVLRRHRRVVLTLLLALGLAAATILLIGRVTSYSRLGRTLRSADTRWFAACVGGELCAYGGYILGYRDVARVDGGPQLRLRVVAEIVAMGFAAFVVASAGGPAVDYWALHRAGLSRDEAIRRVLALNTLKFFVLGAAATLAAAVLLARQGGQAPFALAVPWLAVVPACVAAALVLSHLCETGRLKALRPRGPLSPPHRFRGLEHWLGYLVREGLGDAIAGVVLVRRLLARPIRYAGSSLGWPLYWAGDLLCLYGGVRAFGGHIGVAALVLAYASGYVVSIVPLPAGGTGGVEAAMTFALHLVGVALAPALLGVAAYRFFNFWLPILPALTTLPALRRLPRQLGASDTAARGRLGRSS